MVILDLAALNHDFLPSRITGEVIEESGSHLTEVPASHTDTADVLQVVQLLVLLPTGKAVCPDSLISIVVPQAVDTRNAESVGKHRTVGGISPRCHGGTSCLEHHRPVSTGIRHSLRISLSVTDAEKEVYLITRLVYQVRNTIATLTDTQIVFCQSTS